MDVSAGVVSASANGAESGPAVVPTSSDSQNQTSTQATTPAQTAKPNPVADDPDWDFDGKKVKRSVALKKIKDFEKGAYRAMQEGAEAAKSFKELRSTLATFGVSLEEFKQDPQAALARAAHARVAREVDESLMDPKDREAQRRERDLESREARQRDWEDKRAKDESDSRASTRAEEIAESYAPALKEAGLPRNAKTVSRMADVMIKALRKGVKLTPGEAAAQTAFEISQEQDWHLDQATDANALIDRIGPRRMELILDLPADVLMTKLGPKRLSALREAMLADHRKTPAHSKPQRPTVTQPETTARKYIGWEEYSKQRKGL